MIGIPVARVFGIEIRVQLGWVIVLALIGVIAFDQLSNLDPTLEDPVAWLLGGIVALGFFASSVVHDLAHALVARRRGVDVKAIAVSFFGGSTPLDPAAPDPRDDFAIAASGPLVSLGLGTILFVLGVALISLGDSYSAAAGVVSVLVFLNLLLGLVNLVPAYPLDGGRIVRALAWRRSGSERSGWRAAALSGRLAGFVTIGLGIAVLVLGQGSTGAMIALTGWFLILSANAVRDRARLDDLIGDLRVEDAMERSPVTVTPSLTVDTFASQLLDRDSPTVAVPVVEDGAVVGLLGSVQVRRLARSAWPNTRVVDVMAKPPRLSFLTSAQPMRAALEQLQRTGLDGLPVVDAGKLVGVLTGRGIGRLLAQRSGLGIRGGTDGPGVAGPAGDAPGPEGDAPTPEGGGDRAGGESNRSS